VAARTAVVTDSTADLVPELTTRFGINVVPLTVNLDGQSYLDGVEITSAEFYEKLRESRSHPTTSQPSPGQFKEAYERLLENHEEVVSLHLSGKLSGTLDSARQAAELVGRDRVKVVDSEFVSMPLAGLALVAAQCAERGGGAAEIVEDVNRVREAMRCFFAVSTLEFLRRGGRIGSASALLGSVLQIKPILSIEGGEVAPMERVRTQERALGRLVELGRAVAGAKGLCVVIGHAAAEGQALALAERLDDLAETLIVQPLGPVVGAHAGPGTVGLAAYPAELFPLGLGSRLPAGAVRS
jgi:DegV family protein with EDD domain